LTTARGHILIVPSEHVATEHFPLGGIFQLQQAAALRRAGYTVGIVSPGVITPRFLFRGYRYLEFEDDRGFPVHRRYVRSPLPQRMLSPRRAVATNARVGLAMYQEYVRRHGKPDIVHAHNFRYGAFVGDAIRRAGSIPLVITEHNSEWLRPGMRGPIVDMMRDVVEGASATTAVSGGLARAMERTINVSGIGVLPNIVEGDFFTAPLRAPRTATTAPVFLSIGSLDDNKNHASLIDAFASRFAGTDARLRIGGTGPLRDSHLQRAERLGIGGQVALLGHLSRAAVLSEMQGADCLVLTSRHETFGLVLIEANALGVPVIATRAEGPAELVTDRNGILVDVDDTPALADAMTRMAATLVAYRPAALRESAEAGFGEPAFARRAGELYSRALASA
jgi:glycosyltransferase involved in cell wall biosynthesis